MAPADVEVRVGDGGGAARGHAFRSEAPRATTDAEAGAHDGGDAARGERRQKHDAGGACGRRCDSGNRAPV
jgi:hypothetical protein